MPPRIIASLRATVIAAAAPADLRTVCSPGRDSQVTSTRRTLSDAFSCKEEDGAVVELHSTVQCELSSSHIS